MTTGPNDPHEATQFDHRSVAGRKAYLHQLNTWRDSTKKKGRDTRHIGAYSITEAILMVPFGLPTSWRTSSRRQYHSVGAARADMFVTGLDGDDDGEYELEYSEEDAPTDQDMPWLKQLARIQFLASGDLVEDTCSLHLPPNMQSPIHYQKITGAHKEMLRILCTEKTLALVIFALNTHEFIKPSATDPTQAMYPFSNWVERTTFWRALLNRYPMILIFWVSEAFPILDVAFIFGRAPDSHFLDLRNRLKGALKVRAILGLEMVFRTFANVDPATVNSACMDASFWKHHYRSWLSSKIRVIFSNKNTERAENAVRDDEWPVKGRMWHNNIKWKHWSEGVSTPAGVVVEFDNWMKRSAARKAGQIAGEKKDKGKVVRKESEDEEEMMEEDEDTEEDCEDDPRGDSENSSSSNSFQISKRAKGQTAIS